MTVMRTARLLLPLLVLSGCAANVPQWQQLRSLLPPSAAQRQAADYGWQLRFNGTAFMVFPLQTQGRRVLFSNGIGLTVVFDGDRIERVRGMPGAMGEATVAVGEGGHWYRRGAAKEVFLKCLPLQPWRLSRGHVGSRIECRGEDRGHPAYAVHQVERDGAGVVRRIESTVLLGAAPMVLEPLRYTGQPD